MADLASFESTDVDSGVGKSSCIVLAKSLCGLVASIADAVLDTCTPVVSSGVLEGTTSSAVESEGKTPTGDTMKRPVPPDAAEDAEPAEMHPSSSVRLLVVTGRHDSPSP
mmetsp:Transcript_31436/g.94451  ORF Transcript_31436/g.94451 Transcript_31436/m.94451 type:complete len:110 (+) Transcript_31436:3886-4215(+)